MKNQYEIRGEVTVIFLRRRDGSCLETLIDTDDLPKAMEIDGAWYAYWKPDAKVYYVAGHIGGKYKKLHRWLTDAPVGKVVDHVNHNTLDNRRQENLKVVTISENGQNRIGAMRNNKSSEILNVDWVKGREKWRARICLNGKRKLLGYFSEINDAVKAVKDARSTTLPNSQEARKVLI